MVNEAGRELDTLVVEKVMGKVPCTAWSVFRRGGCGAGPIFIKDAKSCGHRDCYPLDFPAQYSTNISVAWQIVKELLEEELCFYLYTSHGEWICELEIYYVDDDEALILEGAETPELAICLAALKFKGG